MSTNLAISSAGLFGLLLIKLSKESYENNARLNKNEQKTPRIALRQCRV